MVRELDRAAWGGDGIVHIEAAEAGERAARQAIHRAGHHGNPFADPAHLERPFLAHRVVSVGRPGGGFTAVVQVSHLAFDQVSSDILVRLVEDGYAMGGVDGPARRPYADYLRFAVLGPRDVDDECVVRELDLERFAATAAAYAERRPAATVDLEHDLGPEMVPEGAGWLVEDALVRAHAGAAVPVLLPTTGRRYHGGDFADYIGMFTDIVPMVVDPAAPGFVEAAAARIAFLERANLSVAALVADPLIAARYPRAASLLAGALDQHVPVLNTSGLGGSAGAAAGIGGFATRPGWIAGPRRVIHVMHDAGRLAISGLPCEDTTFLAAG
jgi:hypothetical protein